MPVHVWTLFSNYTKSTVLKLRTNKFQALNTESALLNTTVMCVKSFITH